MEAPEIWKAVSGFEGRYEVSNLGRVRSLDHVLWGAGRGVRHAQRIKGRILRPGPKKSGHLSVMLGRYGGSHDVHVLVLSAFVGPRPPQKEGRHLNGEPSQNYLANLEWASRSRNTQDKKHHKGTKTYRLSGNKAKELKDLIGIIPGCEIAKLFGVAQSTVSAIKHGKFHLDV